MRGLNSSLLFLRFAINIIDVHCPRAVGSIMDFNQVDWHMIEIRRSVGLVWVWGYVRSSLCSGSGVGAIISVP